MVCITKDTILTELSTPEHDESMNMQYVFSCQMKVVEMGRLYSNPWRY